ncbi:MAG: SoxR reducing system RseC family protein [Bacteroidales bacterium]|nr:SoxR reducing system RseC family protein [Bacteroidales bacterium]
MSNSIATHDGVVVSIQEQKVTVEMHVISACSTCKAHEKCAFVDKDDKIVQIETPDWKDYAVGDNVIVSVDESLGLLAVLLAYILPAILIIGSVVLLSRISDSEVLVAFTSIAITALYFLILYRAHHRLQKKFSFSLKKEEK